MYVQTEPRFGVIPRLPHSARFDWYQFLFVSAKNALVTAYLPESPLDQPANTVASHSIQEISSAVLSFSSFKFQVFQVSSFQVQLCSDGVLHLEILENEK